MFRIEAKVSCGKVRIARSEMNGLIISWRVGADKKDALNKEEKKKNQSRAERCCCFHPWLLESNVATTIRFYEASYAGQPQEAKQHEI
jgi:hypothetical protein